MIFEVEEILGSAAICLFATLEQDPLPAPLAVPSAVHQRPSAVPDLNR